MLFVVQSRRQHTTGYQSCHEPLCRLDIKLTSNSSLSLVIPVFLDTSEVCFSLYELIVHCCYGLDFLKVLLVWLWKPPSLPVGIFEW